MKIENDLVTRFNEGNATNNFNNEQRQRIFEDIIIQRVKVIQNYVKKHVQRLIETDTPPKGQYNGGRNAQRNQEPVILNSIHNDGMSLDLKIKDIVKWKFEAFD